MKDKTLLGGIIVMVVGAVLIGVVWALFLQPSRTPTEPIAAIPLELGENADRFTLFEIVPDASEVTFELDEVLRGLPTTVVGGGRQIAGQIAVDFENPSDSQIGTISINARTLATDNEFRDNAIHNFILDTETYEYITFSPMQISGLPDTFLANEAIPVEIAGELTVRDITQPVVFSGEVTADGRTQLTGSATAQISRADFNLQIPNAPGVANVSDEILLTIQFLAQ